MLCKFLAIEVCGEKNKATEIKPIRQAVIRGIAAENGFDFLPEFRGVLSRVLGVHETDGTFVRSAGRSVKVTTTWFIVAHPDGADILWSIITKVALAFAGGMGKRCRG